MKRYFQPIEAVSVTSVPTRWVIRLLCCCDLCVDVQQQNCVVNCVLSELACPTHGMHKERTHMVVAVGKRLTVPISGSTLNTHAEILKGDLFRQVV